MKKMAVILFLIDLFAYQVKSQDINKLDGGFEGNQFNTSNKLPLGWIQWGADYLLSIDSLEKHEGKYAMKVASPSLYSAESSFGCIATNIPSIYQGKMIELRAYMKLKDVKGKAGLLLRIDDENKESLEFENMQSKNIHGSIDWALYSVKLKLPEEAKSIYIGALLSGVGTIWVDDFQVLIDGKSLNQVKLRKNENTTSNQNNEFDQGSRLNFNTITPNQTKDLQLVGLIWGFLKYYHPSVARGNYNWDYELIRIIAKVMQTKSASERDATLAQWIEKLGSYTVEKVAVIEKEDLKFSADLAWINQLDMSENLKAVLNNLVNAKRDNDNYYVELEPGVFNPKFKNENKYNKMDFPDTGFRLISLFRYWNMIQYFFPYRNLFDEDWKNILLKFIPKYIQASNELEYKLTVLELIGNIHDTHANIWGDKAIDSYWGNRAIPVELKFVDDTPVVYSILDKDWASRFDIKQGDMVVSINRKSIADILKEKIKYCPASNYSTQLRNLASKLVRSNDSSILYTLNRQGKEVQVSCSTIDDESYSKLIYYKKEDTCFRILDNNIAYINMGNIHEKEIANYFKQAQNTKGLIIDIRNYPAAFTIFSMGKYLVPQSTPVVRWSRTNLKYPGTYTYKYTSSIGEKKNENYYKGKVMILVNEETQSMAEYTAMAFRAAPKAKVLGSTTAGADGNVSKIILPGNIRTTISGIGVYYPDGSETQRVGIVPDIEIKPSVAGIANHQDEVLEKAIEIINQE